MTSPTKEAEAFLEAMVADIDNLTDEELAAELEEAGGDIAQLASHVRGVLADAVAEFQRSRRKALENGRGRTPPRTPMPRLPISTQDKRKLLRRAITRAEQQNIPLTLGFRELGAMTDSDLEALIEQLFELGAIGREDVEESED